MANWTSLFDQARAAFSQQRTWERARTLGLSALTCLGRRTLSALLCASGQQFREWSAAYPLFERERLDGDALWRVPLGRVLDALPDSSSVVALLDDTLVRKRGHRIAGTSWRRDPLGPHFADNFIWASRFLQISLALPQRPGAATGAARAIPVDLLHAPSPRKPSPRADAPQWQNWRAAAAASAISRRGAERITALRHAIDQSSGGAGRALLVCADPTFTNRTVLRDLPPRTTLIGRIRKDARLYALPTAEEENHGRGRRRCYGQRLPTPEQWHRDESLPWQSVRAFAAGNVHEFQIKLITPLRWKHAGGERQLALLIVRPVAYRLRKRAPLSYRNPAYLICTDPTLPPEQILQPYLWRWEIELNFRDEKTLLGSGEPQVRSDPPVRTTATFFVFIYALLLLAGPLNSFRIPAGHLSVSLPFKLTGFPSNTPCLTNQTVYCELKQIGIDLNTFTLDTLPTITPAQITQLATFYAGFNPSFSPNPFQGARPIALANNYESPRSWQWSVGFEHELARGFSVGADFVYVNTVHLQRNLDINLPAPLICAGTPLPAGCKSPGDLSLRPCFGVAGGNCRQSRPIRSLDIITLRTSNARATYRGFTVRTNYRRGRAQFQTYYTLSKNTSTDDNERNAVEFFYDNPFNLPLENGFSQIDARHMFLFNGLVDLPLGFTVSALGRFRSGRPVNPVIGFPLNGAEFGFPSIGDRAFQTPGVVFPRNSFRDRSTQDVDLRVAKKFRLPREGMSLAITADFFNLFNFANVVYTGGSNGISGANREFGPGVILPQNTRFLRLTDPSFCAFNSGCFDTNNFPGANGSIPPFTVQLGIRFQF